MTIEEYLDKPYWVIDILPKQVPADGKGQYFRIEKYFLEHPQIDNIYRRFTNILLKLNCYEDIDVSHDGEEWLTNPTPHELEAALLGLAVLGGSIGALLGMEVWHHKTMHKKFKYGLPLILLVQIALVYFIYA